ncbi:hypothetical protein AVEN_111444-1 [Araneus ventricosus]|uniref:SWIM-type domain-containing protein n=1 Tax=Araneus ventricosus TaxID=182803 RepID=A0A4Y2K115_ARAVE|nr:hypothetical protein AVEN_111444-1 [Araneus ventricosus]
MPVARLLPFHSAAISYFPFYPPVFPPLPFPVPASAPHPSCHRPVVASSLPACHRPADAPSLLTHGQPAAISHASEKQGRGRISKVNLNILPNISKNLEKKIFIAIYLQQIDLQHCKIKKKMKITRKKKFCNVVNNIPAHSKLTKTVKEKHDRVVKIQDLDVVEYDGHWAVKSQSVKGKMYKVRKVADACGLMDHCYFKCANINCAALCSHLYDCSCEDNSNLCKHIHKVHMLYSEIKTHVTNDFTEVDSEENSSAISSGILNVDILSNTESCRSKVTECKKLCSERLESIENPIVKEVILKNAVSCLSTLVASMRRVLNLKNNLVYIAPQLYVAPNQKIIPRVKFYRTSQRKSSKKQRLSKEFFDEPDNPVEQESGVNSFSVENSECAGFNAFQKFNKISVKNPTATILTINIDL